MTEPTDSALTTTIPSGPARDAWQILADGNRRFVSGAPHYRRNITAARAAAAEQHPIAAVFTCVDSRVTAESLFDCDFGQLIVVRTAGHVTDEAAAASLDFAAVALSVPLVIVLGHERCGAVGLAVDAVREDPDGDRDQGYLVSRLRAPAAAGLAESETDPYGIAMRHQVDATVAELRERPGLQTSTVVGACYQLDDGTVGPTW